MLVIKTRNVNQVLPELMYKMNTLGVVNDTRNGPVVKLPEPLTICYEKPCERVIFWPERDANPFFHFLESLWMMAGRNDVAFLKNIVGSMEQFSDDGKTFHGAYGFRWRHHFDKDQVWVIAQALKSNPDCRRQVMGIWDPRVDLGADSKDVPCNTQVFFSRQNETQSLDMMVTNRSNDVVWGMTGANVVHFSFLQELISGLIGCQVGKYWQATMNAHLYLDKHEKLMDIMQDYAFPSSSSINENDLYTKGDVTPTPLLSAGSPNRLLLELDTFLQDGVVLGMHDKFLRSVASPMKRAMEWFKSSKGEHKYTETLNILDEMPEDSDWRRASEEWVGRRHTKWMGKNE